jgi:hypothetical protein
MSHTSESGFETGMRGSGTAPSAARSRSDIGWYLAVAAAVELLALLPYLYGYGLSQGRRYLWLGALLDDYSVYLGWMRQAADGSFRQLNLFTTAQQHGMAANPLFLLLGRCAALTHLPLIGVFHGARILFGVALLLLVRSLLLELVSDDRARRIAFLFVCFGSGLGWLPIWWDVLPTATPIDKWQPEAITFLSLYLNPLFAAALALQVSIFLCLWRGIRTGRMRFPVCAGLCGLLLGLVHTYDVISAAAVWLAFLAALSIASARNRASGGDIPRAWMQGLASAAISSPGALFMLYQLRQESLFQQRAAVPTLSPSLVWVMAGYGALLLLAVCGARAFASARPGPGPSRAGLLLVVWMTVNVAVAYAPVSFQRKLIQGAHFPIAILAGIGFAWLLSKRRAPGGQSEWVLLTALATLLLFLTNGRFIARDIQNDRQNIALTGIHRPYVQPGEIEALHWLAAHTSKADAVQPLFWIAGYWRDERDLQAGAPPAKVGVTDMTLAVITPGEIDRRVYTGHWGETPDFGSTMSAMIGVLRANTPDDVRRDLLRRMGVRYLVFSQKAPDPEADRLMPMFRGQSPLPPYLQRVYSNPDADVYRIDLAAQQAPGY